MFQASFAPISFENLLKTSLSLLQKSVSVCPVGDFHWHQLSAYYNKGIAENKNQPTNRVKGF